jgi:hypothetical protein
MACSVVLWACGPVRPLGSTKLCISPVYFQLTVFSVQIQLLGNRMFN